MDCHAQYRTFHLAPMECHLESNRDKKRVLSLLSPCVQPSVPQNIEVCFVKAVPVQNVCVRHLLPMWAVMFVCLCACPFVCLSPVRIANANVLVWDGLEMAASDVAIQGLEPAPGLDFELY